MMQIEREQAYEFLLRRVSSTGFSRMETFKNDSFLKDWNTN